MFISHYFLIGLIIYFFNLIPVFTPPTWMVISVFSLKYHVLLFPLVVTGALGATLGRVSLALLAKRFVRPFIPQKSQKNLATLGSYLNTHHHVTIPLVLTYAFLPFPSNQIFIAAGLADVNLKVLGYSFFIGRVISYTFWTATSHLIARQLIQHLNQETGKLTSIILEILGVLMILFLIRFDWSKYILKYLPHDKNEHA